MPTLVYFEDLVLDERLETPGLTLTEAHVRLFRGFAPEACEDPVVVPELLPLCLSTGLAWRVARPPVAVLAFMGLEWRALSPLRVGDTIRSRSRTVTKRGMRDGGVVVEERDIVNQRDEIAQHGRLTLLVARKPA